MVYRLGKQQKVVAAEVLGFTPEVTVTVQSGHRDVMAVAGFRLVEPDVYFDIAEPDAVDGLLCHGFESFKTD